MNARKLRLGATAIAALLPGPLARWALNALGHRIAAGARIGLSLLLVERIAMERGSWIGHFNVMHIRRLAMRSGSHFGRRNLIRGPLSIALGPRSIIGNRNKIVRGPLGEVTVGPALLRLGELSSFTADHRIDCTASVRLGDFTTVAGVGCEIWTHGYIHDTAGAGRYRLDGRVTIGSNVYIGSSCIVTAGVHIADGVIVGAGATIARSLEGPAMYVSAALRQLDRPPAPEIRADLQRVQDPRLCEPVFIKRRSAR
ncbi:MAG: hypothetical protein KGI35_00175 [Burkholderiales bacterium]|nr:hypothetical protein [Burkholderiales bacterium]MDE2397019.1 hypothetical protein [Burkholderiales bacterium]